MKSVKLSIRDVDSIATSRLYWEYIWRIVGCICLLLAIVLVLAISGGISADNPKERFYEPLFDEPEGINLVITGDMRIAEYGNYHWGYVESENETKVFGIMLIALLFIFGPLFVFAIWYIKKQEKYREQVRKEFGLDDKIVEVK